VRGDYSTSLSLLDGFAQPDPWARPAYLALNGRAAGALAIYRTLAPELFKQPIGSTPIAFPAQYIDVATAMQMTGGKDQAEKLLRHGLRMTASRPFSGTVGRYWSEVTAYALLGDMPKACAALDEAATQGFLSGYRSLETNPVLAPLRKQPCFQPQFDRLRAQATKQVEAAHKAGLL
jgi:hypothetical protein